MKQILIYVIQHKCSGKWYDSNLDAFGYPEGFKDSDPCFQKTGVHGTLKLAQGLSALGWMALENKGITFKLVKKEVDLKEPVAVMSIREEIVA